MVGMWILWQLPSVTLDRGGRTFNRDEAADYKIGRHPRGSLLKQLTRFGCFKGGRNL